MKKKTEHKYFKNFHLSGKDIFLPGNRLGVLLLHGFTATTVEVRDLAEYLNKKGCTVHAPLLPGHGTTPDDLNNRKFTDWIKCAEAAYLLLNNHVDQLIVGGESMGAVLSLYLAQHNKDIKALLLYSPALETKNINYAKPLSLIMKYFRKKKDDDRMLWQGYTVYPLKAAVELHKLQVMVKNELFRINQPTLVCQGEFDKTIDKDNSNFIVSNISSTIKCALFFKNSGHVMLLDKEKEYIFNQTWEFINSGKIL